MKVFTLMNPKGGSAKTTTAFHCTISLATKGRTLAIDLDMQADLSDAFFPDEPVESFDSDNTLTVLRSTSTLAEAIKPKFEAHILVGTDELEDFAYHASQDQTLVGKLSSIVRKSDYDYVIIDTPGSGGSENISALIATDVVLIPVVPNKWATRTIKRVLKKVNQAQNYINLYQDQRQLQCFILPTKWGRPNNPSSRAIQILDQLKNYDLILRRLKETQPGFELVNAPVVLDPIPIIKDMDEKTEFGEFFKPNTAAREYYDNLVRVLLGDSRMSPTPDKYINMVEIHE